MDNKGMASKFTPGRQTYACANMPSPQLEAQTNPQNRNSQIQNFSVEQYLILIYRNRAARENNSFRPEGQNIFGLHFTTVRHQAKNSKLFQHLLDQMIKLAAQR